MNKFFRSLFDLLHVPRCGGCRSLMDSSVGICEQCKRLYMNEKDEFCDFCGMSVSICTCVPYNMNINGCIDYRKLVFYRKSEGTAPIRTMIYRIKRSNDIELIKFFARELYNIDKGFLPEGTIITYSPRLKKAVKKYGYDQGRLLAENYAAIGEYEVKALLRRKNKRGQKQQKLLNFKQRAANIKGSFEICDENCVRGKTVLLIDDVVTSGATLGECVSLLYDAGAKSVICRTIAYTYRNNKRKND